MAKSSAAKKQSVEESPVVEETPQPTREQEIAQEKKIFQQERAQEIREKQEARKAKRKERLRELLAAAVERYKMVHGISLTHGDLKDYADWCMKTERRRFLEDKFVMLSTSDQELFAEILVEASK